LIIVVKIKRPPAGSAGGLAIYLLSQRTLGETPGKASKIKKAAKVKLGGRCGVAIPEVGSLGLCG
jgi:hypothetical protein